MVAISVANFCKALAISEDCDVNVELTDCKGGGIFLSY